jgi:hypothetical protein
MRDGANEDLVADELGLGKTTLRRQYIRPLSEGREARRQQRAGADGLTREEQHVADLILKSFSDGDWLFRGRCLLWRGTDGDFAKTPEDAYARWLADGRGWITAGLARNFNAEQLQAFAALKAAAERLRG